MSGSPTYVASTRTPALRPWRLECHRLLTLTPPAPSITEVFRIGFKLYSASFAIDSVHEAAGTADRALLLSLDHYRLEKGQEIPLKV